MKFNVVSNLGEDYNPDLILQYNKVIAWSLRRALEEAGHEVFFVRDHADEAPPADHSIVISNWAMNRVRDDSSYLAMLREATGGKLGLWLDAAFSGMEELYDVVFTVTPPYEHSSSKFKWAGFAAYPDIFYPEQESRPTAFVDSYMYGWYGGEYDYSYDILRAVLDGSKIQVLQPIEQYNKGKRIPWAQLASLFRRCHFSIVTQLGNWGLTNIETATCGALLVLHKPMERAYSWPCDLNHVFWENQADLSEILSRPVDIEANRAKALENTWTKVVDRLMEVLR